MPRLDLHKLANEGGYGAARQALEKLGYWDESRANGSATEPAGKRKFLVTVRATLDVEAGIVVEAETPEEAEEIARDRAETRPQSVDWDPGSYAAPDFLEIVDVEAHRK